MEKRLIAVFIALFGVIIIVLSSTFIKFSQSAVIKENTYLVENLKDLAKKCILEEKCERPIVTLQNLLDNNYLNDELKEKIKEYTTDSYIVYPSNEVVLTKAD